ncbi:MAG: zinc ribbon domain-containing protein [Anaerolineae bacterium]|nr:zinc ribbon domain-containing protein [Anaerolineae bacterium]
MSLDREAFNTILLYAITAAGAVIAATWLGLILWTWRDIRQRSRDPLAPIAASLMVAVLGLFGIIIYVLLRPRETLTESYERSLEEEALLQNIEERPICPGCGRPAKEGWQVCPYCHTKLKKPCAHCGELLELPWNLCPYCAMSQVPATAAQPRQSRAVPAPAHPAEPSHEATGEAVEFVEEDPY